jgi:thioredoxin-related protein
MKEVLKVFIPLVLVVAFIAPRSSLPIGAEIPQPDLKVKDVSGTLVSLREAKTPAGLLVMFSCNTCPYVIKNQGRTRDICQFAQSQNLGVIILNSNEGGRKAGGESFADMQSYARKEEYNWFYALDSDNTLADAFGATRTPECFLFDREGKLVYHGAIDDSPADISEVKRKHLRLAMEEMALGKKVSVSESRSIGCSIKRRS